MSTVPKRRGAPPPEPEHYRYGWRDVPQTNARGRVIDYVRVPLTLEDVLHPQEGDVILQNDPHDKDRTYLRYTFEAQLAHEPHALVLSDCGIFWDVAALRHHSPDLAVIFGVREQRRWDTFHVAEEGVRPSLLIEITSPSTRSIDMRQKRRQYFQAQVPLYVIVDAQEEGGERVVRMLGYRRGQRRYQRLPLNDEGRLWLEPVQLWLGSAAGRVVCYDAQGRPCEDFTEMKDRAEAAEEGKAQQRLRAEAADERAAQERQRAEQERQRAAQEHQRAEQERQRAEALEQRLREMETELRRARGEE